MNKFGKMHKSELRAKTPNYVDASIMLRWTQ